MNSAQRQALLQELFGRDPGIGLSFTRLTIGASDFSRRHYSLDDVPAGRTDPALQQFSIARNLDDVVPVTQAALKVNPQLKVMASPWSAPAWMKSTGSLIKGTLLEAHYDAFARYLVKYLDAYAREGVPVFALTLQNEPSFEPGDYPGMRLSARARADLIGKHLGPMLEQRSPNVQILDWDHNWDLPNEPLAVLADPPGRALRRRGRMALLGGDVSAQSKVREAAPDKDVYMTECSGGDWEPVRSGGLTLQARQLIVGTTRHWARGVLFWNLALDETGGPHAGGCGNCRGVVTIDSRTGMVSRTDDYYALAHASRFVRPGASRIASSADASSWRMSHSSTPMTVRSRWWWSIPQSIRGVSRLPLRSLVRLHAASQERSHVCLAFWQRFTIDAHERGAVDGGSDRRCSGGGRCLDEDCVARAQSRAERARGNADAGREGGRPAAVSAQSLGTQPGRATLLRRHPGLRQPLAQLPDGDTERRARGVQGAAI